MDANFNEQQAFEQAFDDLQNVLYHMYTIAGKFYAAAKAAQCACAEKDKIIADLKAEHEKKFADLQSTFEETSREQFDKISDLEAELKNEHEQFTAHLNKYGDYNVRLTNRLESFERTLNDRSRNLDRREENLSDREKSLEADRRALETEREDFDKEKYSMQEKVDAYDKLNEAVRNSDEEKRQIRNKLNGQISELQQQHADALKNIQHLEADKKVLEEQVENLRKQLDSLNRENMRLKQGNENPCDGNENSYR